MALYEVNHVLLGPGPVDASKKPSGFQEEEPGDRIVLKPGEQVSSERLKELGFNIDRLLTKKDGGYSAAITLVRGTEDMVDLKSRFAPRNPDLAAAQTEDEDEDLNKDGTVDDLEKMRMPELLALASQRGLDTTVLGTKKLLVEALSK